MRVVAGSARGRPLRAPAGPTTRPTSDRVREALFSMLTSMDVIEGASVVDLFAGSGALGIEALSRGASSAVFVDDDRAAAAAIRANLDLLGEDATRGTVVAGDAVAWSQRTARTAGADAGAAGSVVTPFDLAFADPPYAWAGWAELMASLAVVADLVVVETGAEWDGGPEWETVKARRYGSTVVTIVRRLLARGGK